MGLLSFGGIGSGIDTNSIIDALVTAEATPKKLSLDRREANLQLTLSGVGSLKSALSDLQTAAKALNESTLFDKRTVSTSTTTNLTASTSNTAVPGSYDIEVTALAQGSKHQTSIFASGSSTTFGAGTLTFTVGSKSFNVTVGATDTLADIRTAINDASDNIGVNVSLLNNVTDGMTTGSILTIDSTTTGAGNDLAVTFTGDASLADLSTNLTSTQTAGDAAVKFGALTSSSATNTFSSLIDGLDITVKKVNTSGETTTITVAKDSSGVATKVSEFVDAFNNYSSIINGLSSADSNAPGLLLGDAVLRQANNQIRGLLGTEVTGINSDFNSLVSLGVTTNKDGTLTLDSTKLNNAISSNIDDVKTLFTSNDGFAKQLETTIDRYVGTNGTLVQRETSINEQLTEVSEERVVLTARLEQLEVRLRSQYAAMDALVAQSNSTQQFLTQQLASLPGFSSGNKSSSNS
ncbi:flagellar filament capping protein FliD [Pleionea sp. CnH1-48]|uniref:flagellar filament capping protein FliD n=1 Tax=Pleionea sp. CnH1-48 TaxID=2954494 RepID=UPI00209812AC|nr:flagellar filament capping protein FliD [Pleionea sp. CnH1-48]MCO7226147.1 flagellar filament capping protein FliD [Pleionea sp. CnH1-48]